MYLITCNDKMFAVNVKDRTCLVGFRDSKVATKVMSNLCTNGTKIRLKGVHGLTSFNTEELTDISVVESSWELGCLIDLNYMMVFMTDDLSAYKSILTLHGDILDQEYDDLNVLRAGYLNELYRTE